MMAKAITTEEWLAELEQLGRKSPATDGMLSVAEMCEMTGKSTRIIRDNLARAQSLGILEVGHRQCMRIDARTGKIPVYRICRKK
jgi:hypothetical protein